MDSSSNQQQAPGLVASHAQYVKGAATETIGNLTSSEEWAKSGAETKEQALHDMKAASKDRDPAKDGYGKVEEVAGKITGCEGMKDEGAASKQ